MMNSGICLQNPTNSSPKRLRTNSIMLSRVIWCDGFPWLEPVNNFADDFLEVGAFALGNGVLLPNFGLCEHSSAKGSCLLPSSWFILLAVQNQV
jgi:hypothetical protein